MQNHVDTRVSTAGAATTVDALDILLVDTQDTIDTNDILPMTVILLDY